MHLESWTPTFGNSGHPPFIGLLKNKKSASASELELSGMVFIHFQANQIGIWTHVPEPSVFHFPNIGCPALSGFASFAFGQIMGVQFCPVLGMWEFVGTGGFYA
jgi:hypothetical protein